MYKYPYLWFLKDNNFTKDRGTVFSTFACAGGSTMGYKLAGFDHLGCCEIDHDMSHMYNINHKPKIRFSLDIRTFLKKENLPEELFHLDILDQSFPCSSFSVSGDREISWGIEKQFKEGQKMQKLDDLAFESIKLVKRLQPKVSVFENVKGLMIGKAREYVRRIYKEMDEAGYFLQHWLVDAQYMGVPQRRERVFFIGLRKDLCDGLMKYVDMFTLAPYIDMKFNEKPILFGQVRSEHGLELDTERCALMKHAIEGDASLADVNKRLNDGKVSGFNAQIMYDNKIGSTITAGETFYRFFDKKACTEYDYTVCSTFPQDFYYAGNLINKGIVKYVQGMSVPPIMTAHIADRIWEHFLSKLNHTKIYADQIKG